MKLLADPEPTPKRKVDETANTASTIRFQRKQRLIQQLEVFAKDDRVDVEDVIDALVSYVDDKYIRHLADKIQYPQALSKKDLAWRKSNDD